MVALPITHAVNLSLGVGGLKFNQISKLAQYELNLKISSKSVHNFSFILRTNQPTNQPTNRMTTLSLNILKG